MSRDIFAESDEQLEALSRRCRLLSYFEDLGNAPSQSQRLAAQRACCNECV
jgi:hypothetical protein